MAESYRNYTGDGSVDLFNVTFPYINRGHVYVFVDGFPVPYEWFSSGTVRLEEAPADGAFVRIERQTPATPIVDFENGTNLTAQELDMVSIQSLYLSQESKDRSQATMAPSLQGFWDALDKRISNVLDPVSPEDAVNKRWVETAMTSQVQRAAAEADAAKASAGAAASSAGDASDAVDEAEAAQQAAEDARDDFFDLSVTAQTVGNSEPATAVLDLPGQTLTFNIPEGGVGPAGPRGYSVLNGTGEPAAGVGVDGDFYIDKDSKKVHGPKNNGVWPAGADLVGPRGKPGPEGISAYAVAVNNGFEGTQSEWLESLIGPEGEQGISAYDVAVNNGFEGTQSEWLESLIGPEGEEGPEGPQQFNAAVSYWDVSGEAFEQFENVVRFRASGDDNGQLHWLWSTGSSSTHWMGLNPYGRTFVAGGEITFEPDVRFEGLATFDEGVSVNSPHNILPSPNVFTGVRTLAFDAPVLDSWPSSTDAGAFSAIVSGSRGFQLVGRKDASEFAGRTVYENSYNEWVGFHTTGNHGSEARIFPDRTDLAGARVPLAEGAVVYLKGLHTAFKKQSGATAIADLPDLVPLQPFTPYQFGVSGAGATGAQDRDAMRAMWAYARTCPGDRVHILIPHDTFSLSPESSTVMGDSEGYMFRFDVNKHLDLEINGTMVRGSSWIGPVGRDADETISGTDELGIFLFAPPTGNAQGEVPTYDLTLRGSGTVDISKIPAKTHGVNIVKTEPGYRRVHVEGLFFDHGLRGSMPNSSNPNWSGGGDSSLDLGASEDLVVERCHFRGAPDCAIYISGGNGQFSSTASLGNGESYLIEGIGRRVRIRDNIMIGCDNAVQLKREVRDSIVVNNIIEDGRNGISTGNTSSGGQNDGERGDISGNTIRRMNGNPIELSHGYRWRVTNNEITDWRCLHYDTNVMQGGGVQAAITLAGIGHAIVSGNILSFERWTPETGDTSNHQAGVSVGKGGDNSSSKYILVYGNTIINILTGIYRDSSKTPSLAQDVNYYIAPNGDGVAVRAY